jgi:cytochrome c553
MNRIVFVMVLITAALPVQADLLLFGDAARGEKLHAGQCQGCHDTRVYTRPDRRIRSAEGLMQQVNLCNQNLRKGFAKDQLDDLVKYLNDSFYKFK